MDKTFNNWERRVQRRHWETSQSPGTEGQVSAHRELGSQAVQLEWPQEAGREVPGRRLLCTGVGSVGPAVAVRQQAQQSGRRAGHKARNLPTPLDSLPLKHRDFQRILVTVSLLSPKSHTNFSLVKSKLEPHREGDGDKPSSRLATWYTVKPP